MLLPQVKAPLLCIAAAVVAFAGWASPSKAIEVSIAVPEGAGPNVEQLADRMKIVLETIVGTRANVVRRNDAPEGAGIVLLSSDQLAGAPSLDLATLEPLALLTVEYQVLVVSSASSFGSLSDVILTMRKRPQEIEWVVDPQSSAGIRGAIYEILDRGGVDVTKVRFVSPKWGHDPERSLAANAVTLAPVSAVIDDVRENSLRGLAFTSSFRADGLEVPTFDEQGLGASNYSWTAVMVDREIGGADREMLAAMIEQMVATSEWGDWLGEKGAYDYYIPAPNLGSFLTQESKSIIGGLALAPSNFQ
jgi:putative tricarboxylic transport membrane protein